MGYFKNVDIERLQNEELVLEAETAMLRRLQPVLSPDFEIYNGADSLLDFVKAYKVRRPAAPTPLRSIAKAN